MAMGDSIPPIPEQDWDAATEAELAAEEFIETGNWAAWRRFASHVGLPKQES